MSQAAPCNDLDCFMKLARKSIIVGLRSSHVPAFSSTLSVSEFLKDRAVGLWEMGIGGCFWFCIFVTSPWHRICSK